ncbi:TonB-dependent receptor [Sphingomonas jatrophae]|uniref:Iron complex outermembrane recepter protein n=1 Tax=Sphingomonas jatrophae TaxID=1166337 RepID=A0A1I6L0R4_9SPHN|nr:TonB-dependent siderophore receptor [Sphingomonas jatrophae]SFR96858.1 iron complex outermembrane recepter protein [Sphingomonas jatrophae]
MAFATLATPAVAQASQDKASDEIVVTAQQRQKQVVSDGSVGVLGDKSALETPFNVTSYTAQLVLDQQAETLGDVLENEPSVRTTQGFGNQAELFVIRGFALNGDDVAMDGLFGITPRQLVSPELYERVQVLNGANAFLFGAAPGGSGVGGSINLIPKRATKTLLRATASYSQESVFGGNVDLGTRFGDEDTFGIRVNGVYRSGDSPIDRERRRVGVAGAGFDVRRGPVRFTLDFGYEDQRVHVPRPQVRLANSGVAVPRVPGSTANYAQNWAFTKLRDVYALARVEADLAPGLLAYASGGFRDGREEGDYATITLTNGATGAGTQSRLYVPREDNNEAGQAGVRGSFEAFGVSHEVNAGGSANWQENRNAFASGSFPAASRTPCGAAATAFCTNLYNPVLVPRPADSGAQGNFRDPPRVSRTVFKSLFLSDTLGFAQDRVLLTVGARRQWLDIDSYARLTGLRTARYEKAATTPVIGIAVRPTETFTVYANRIEALVQGPTAPNNANTLNAGEIFAPFRSKQYEVGGKLAVRGLTATLAFFQTRQPNSFNQPTPTATNPAALTFVVEGQQRNRGIELSLNGEPAEGVRIIGGLAINDAKQVRTLNGTNDGNKAIGVPDYQANVGVEVVPPFLKAATLTARMVKTGEQFVDVGNLQRLRGWTRFDLGARYVVVANGHPVTLRLSAENIDNRRFWYSAFGGYLVQGGPRTIKASATFEY